jgi:hypothetical protein
MIMWNRISLVALLALCVGFGVFFTAVMPLRGSPPPDIPAAGAVPLGVGWHVWTDITANPQNPDNLVLCGARWLPFINRMGSFAYVSEDGGNTWTLSLDDRSTMWQSCAFGPHNAVFFNSESSRVIDGDLHHELGETHFYRSLDGGRSWISPSLDGWFDHSAMAVTSRGIVYLFANDCIIGRFNTLICAPALKISRDGGRSLSPVIQLPASSRANYNGAYPSAARVLKSGRVLAVMYSRHKDGPLQRGWGIFNVDVVWSDDGKTLHGPANVWKGQGCGAEGNQPAMAVDSGRRVYVAFGAPKDARHFFDDAVCLSRLAYSDDGGVHWVNRVVPGSGNSAATVVAVNNKGIVGVAWARQPDNCWQFAWSRDRARTFSRPILLESSCRRLVGTDRWFPNSLQVFGMYESSQKATKSQEMTDFGKLGFVARGWTASDWRSNMVATADGIFHIVWPQDGNGWLRVAAVRVPSTGNPIVENHVLVPASVPLAQLAAPAIIPAYTGSHTDLTDISSSIGITFTGSTYDYRTKTLVAQMYISNRGSLALYSPMIWKISHIESDIGVPIGVNAPYGKLLDLTNFFENGILPPFGRSKPIVLTFRIRHYHPNQAIGWSRIVSLSSRIWAQTAQPSVPLVLDGGH